MAKSLWQGIVDTTKRMIGLEVPEDNMTDDSKRVYMTSVIPEKVEEASIPEPETPEMALGTRSAMKSQMLPMFEANEATEATEATEETLLAGSPNRHVLPHSDGWQIKQPDNDQPLAIFKKKTDATTAAREMCLESKGELFIHGKNGKIQSRNSYGNDDPKRKG